MQRRNRSENRVEANQASPMIEALEQRQMLSAAPFASVSRHGALTVSGTRHADHITINRSSKTLYVTENGNTLMFNARSVSRMVVLGGAGDDSIDVGSTVAPTGGVEIDAGDGNDTVHGGGGHEVINGEAGNDSLFGGVSDDTLNGGLGDDSLTGGSGNDLIDGGDGVDHELGSGGHDTLRGDSGDDLQGGTDDTVERHQGGGGGSHDNLDLGKNIASVLA